tara:strand:+ start:2137 stop:2466 length:330 start_codon:yes stop_codon:yes gene_type:complete
MKVTKKDLKNFKGDKRGKKYKKMKLAYDKSIETKNVDDVGIGTTIEKVLKATGVSKIVEVFTPEGKDCGCDERKRLLNNSPLLTYRRNLNAVWIRLCLRLTIIFLRQER